MVMGVEYPLSIRVFKDIIHHNRPYVGLDVAGKPSCSTHAEMGNTFVRYLYFQPFGLVGIIQLVYFPPDNPFNDLLRQAPEVQDV